MDVYDALVEKAMEYLSDNHFTKSALSSHRVCYREFRNHLDNYGLTYSIEVGNRWLEDNKPTWPPWLYRSRRKCLQRIEELQTYGKVINVQYYGHVYDYDLLNASFQEHLDAFLDSISKSRADQTVKCCRCACASFLMFMQNRDRDCLDDIEYSDLIAFHNLDTHKSKEHNECYIREFLEFAASKAWCSKGFSVLLSPQIIHRAMFLETFTIVDPQEFESLRIQSLDFPPDEFLASIEQFVSASEEKRYCSAFLRMARRCLLSLYLFLDINGFGYTPEISDLWLLEMKPQLDSQFVEWRRILEQYKKYSEEGDFNPGVVFSYQPDPIEALPGWITEELLRFLSMKKKEGLSESSLKSYKTTVIHFSEFLMETGITEFSSITADILLQFNQTDQHATAKGKSTVNSLVSVFIEYLEDADILENKHLHKVLPRRSAKNVKLIETLSEEEVELLDNINPSDMSPLGLRDCAMVLVARRLGFRSSDIVDIEYHDIDWKNDTISTLQRKTKKGLILPLPNDVRNAIVRYMKYGRPYSRCPKIFIKHMVPYNGMTVSACGDALSRLLHGKKGQPVKFHRTRKSYGTGLVRGGAAHDRRNQAMSEKMLVTQALDERDLLVKKIGDKISKMKLVDVKKRNEEKTADSRVTLEEFASTASAAYQSIMDLIDRFQRIDAAIVASNAASTVKTSYGEFTVAGAIALRNRLKGNGIYDEDGAFETRLSTQLERQYQSAVQTADYKNKSLESQAETMRLSILGKDSKVKDPKPLEVVDAYIRENTTEVIDPLESQKKVQELKEKVDTLLTELDTQIKVSNATTTIEF